MTNLNFAPGDLVRARNREWVALPSVREGVLALRPLSGSESDTVLLNPALETLPVESARFDLPDNAKMTTQAKSALLADALRLTLRRGAGPFRSAAHLTFEPRIYQLVPLLMALRQPVPRLLIADDVGVGKTIEAGLILRELMDRGEVQSFAVLCPPHLVEQWVSELNVRFGIDAEAVTSASATKLERKLPVGQSLFDAYLHTVVSLDYIKAERRRDNFARTCPSFIIIDEAHSCVGTHGGKQMRFRLISGLAKDANRGIIMLTATPHSGDEQAFARLLSLINPDFEEAKFDDANYRERLSRHFVQRCRADIASAKWKEEKSFPKHNTTERPYNLSEDHLKFHDAVLKYCFELVAKVEGDRKQQRLTCWSILALMRCVGSSPAAGLSTLRNRASGKADHLEPHVYDEDGDEEDAVDVEPSAHFKADQALTDLKEQAEKLVKKPDPKLTALIDELVPLIKKKANPVIFCRYLATAVYVQKALAKKFTKATVEVVTGQLTPDARRACVDDMADKPTPRILVATDCLSEGINLQMLFDTVIHYDLSWNPTRHQQREGRVDRFGQHAKLVRSMMMFSPDSAIDGAVLEVILRKAAEIRKATGVNVPLPDERGPVTDALMSSMMIRQKSDHQYNFELRTHDGKDIMETHWRDVADKEKKSQTYFAQSAMKPQEVIPEWDKAKALLGSLEDVYTFVNRTMGHFGAALEPKKSTFLAHINALDLPLKERLSQRELSGSISLATAEPAAEGSLLLSRTHPLTATLAEALVEASLDPESMTALGLGRTGAWKTPAVKSLTRIVLLRIRYKLKRSAGNGPQLLLAEEAALVAFDGNGMVGDDAEARKLLNTEACADLAESARIRFISEAKKGLSKLLDGPIREFVQKRADVLTQDHGRLAKTVKSADQKRKETAIVPTTVEAVQPPDVIGLFVLVPGEV